MKRYSILLIIVAAAVALLGCGAEMVQPPAAGHVFLDVPDTSTVWLDGLELGEGPRMVTWIVNWPNYLRIDDWRMVVWSAAGMDTLRLCGESRPVEELSPLRIEQVEAITSDR
jgi:hypothetical protein